MNQTRRQKGPPKLEDVKKPKVGKFYLVPHVQLTSWMGPCYRTGDWIPVLGPRHEDSDLGVTDEHFHVDWRFVKKALTNYLLGGSVRRGFNRNHISARVQRNIVSKSHKEVIFLKKRCNRNHLTFPGPFAAWFPALEAKYAGAVAKCMICPHRGMPLAGAPVRDGALVCPGHGLAWDKNTLLLKPRPNSVGDRAKA